MAGQQAFIHYSNLYTTTGKVRRKFSYQNGLMQGLKLKTFELKSVQPHLLIRRLTLAATGLKIIKIPDDITHTTPKMQNYQR